MSEQAILLAPEKPAIFDPAQHCAECQYPLVIDKTVQTVCQHTFHEICINSWMAQQDKQLRQARENNATSGKPFKEPDVENPCPCCAQSIEWPWFPTITTLPARDTEEDGLCSICTLPKVSPIIKDENGRLFHAQCAQDAAINGEVVQEVEIVTPLVTFLVIVSAVAYLANLIFFAGANPILYAIGFPIGVIFSPIVQATLTI